MTYRVAIVCAVMLGVLVIFTLGVVFGWWNSRKPEPRAASLLAPEPAAPEVDPLADTVVHTGPVLASDELGEWEPQKHPLVPAFFADEVLSTHAWTTLRSRELV